MAPTFIRQDYMRHIKLGKNRKKLLKWRRPKGRHSKMRKQRKGYPASPTVGYKASKKEYGLIKGFLPFIVNNVKELDLATKKNIIVISRRVGTKKKVEIIKKAESMKLPLLNVKQGVKNETK
ncbi:MAG: eL32 family ribosomal protein [Nanoarchaeota archaeon]|nr:eL32 family ribosomal protein [Nanoarchaeota archaeon]